MGKPQKKGRPRKFNNSKQLEDAWEGFKNECDNQIVTVNEFSQKYAQFVTAQLKRRIAYSIEGFCVFAHLTRSAFYDTYENAPEFSDIVTRMREECEVDTSLKLQTGEIPSQLAGLLLSRYGYSTKTENKTESKSQISGTLELKHLDLSSLSDDELNALNELTQKINPL